MRNIIGKDVTNSHFRLVEMKILMFFKFNVAVPTVAHFIEFYKEYFHCDRDFYNYEITNVLKNKFDSMILLYQDIVLESKYWFILYNFDLLIKCILNISI